MAIITKINYIKKKKMKNFIKSIFSQSFFNSIKLGVKKGYSIPNLPVHIIEFTNKPLIRIIRFLGGVSFISMMSKSYLNYPLWFLAILTFFTLIFTIYHCYLTYHRIKHIRFLFKSGAYEVRNSPLDRLAFLAARAIGCLKGVCDSAQPVGLGLGLMVTADEFFKAANVEPIFTPFIGNAVKSLIVLEELKTNCLIQTLHK